MGKILRPNMMLINDKEWNVVREAMEEQVFIRKVKKNKFD